jgi:hypothetical protein
MKSPTPRIRTDLARRAVDLAISGGQHQVLIDEYGRTRILPVGVDVRQADEAALDAEIQGLIDGHGDAAH